MCIRDRKYGLPELAHEIVDELKFHFNTHYGDPKDSIGKQDELAVRVLSHEILMALGGIHAGSQSATLCDGRNLWLWPNDG